MIDIRIIFERIEIFIIIGILKISDKQNPLHIVERVKTATSGGYISLLVPKRFKLQGKTQLGYGQVDWKIHHIDDTVDRAHRHAAEKNLAAKALGRS